MDDVAFVVYEIISSLVWCTNGSVTKYNTKLLFHHSALNLERPKPANAAENATPTTSVARVRRTRDSDCNWDVGAAPWRAWRGGARSCACASACACAFFILHLAAAFLRAAMRGPSFIGAADVCDPLELSFPCAMARHFSYACTSAANVSSELPPSTCGV